MLKKYTFYLFLYLIFCLLFYLFFEFKNSIIEKHFDNYFKSKIFLIDKGKNNKKNEIIKILEENIELINNCKFETYELLIEHNNKKYYFEKRKDNYIYICDK